MEMEIEEPPKEPEPQQPEIKIRKDYVRAPLRPTDANRPKFQVCPRCGQEIPVDQMADHMRAELLDPKYRIQKQTQERNLISAATDDEIGRNLGAFARRRTDIFGEEELQIGKSSDAQQAAQQAQQPFASNAMPRTVPTPMPIPKPTLGPTANVPSGPLPPPAPATGTSGPGLLPQPSGPAPPRPPLLPTPPAPPMGPAVHQMPFVPRPHPPMAEPPAKRPKVEETPLIPEEEFLSKHQGSITLNIQVPQEDKPEWKLNGQTLSYTFDLKETVSAVKDKIASELGMPTNKQKLKSTKLPVLKDNQTLAFYNLTNESALQLVVKARGGKK